MSRRLRSKALAGGRGVEVRHLNDLSAEVVIAIPSHMVDYFERAEWRDQLDLQISSTNAVLRRGLSSGDPALNLVARRGIKARASRDAARVSFAGRRLGYLRLQFTHRQIDSWKQWAGLAGTTFQNLLRAAICRRFEEGLRADLILRLGKEVRA